MTEIDKIIRAVESSMRLSGYRLSDDDKKRIRLCLENRESADSILRNLIAEHTASDEMKLQ